MAKQKTTRMNSTNGTLLVLRSPLFSTSTAIPLIELPITITLAYWNVIYQICVPIESTTP